MGCSSVIAVLLLGNTLGAVVKGITGFGSAIINLSVWVVATVAGINAGTLQQAVLTECIMSQVLAVPLLFATRAHTTCDWGLVSSLSLFGALGAPVGAAMLTHLPPRQTEFAVACLVLLVILLNAWQGRCNAASKQQQQQPQDQEAQPLCCRDAAVAIPTEDCRSGARLDWTEPSAAGAAAMTTDPLPDTTPADATVVLLLPAAAARRGQAPAACCPTDGSISISLAVLQREGISLPGSSSSPDSAPASSCGSVTGCVCIVAESGTPLNDSSQDSCATTKLLGGVQQLSSQSSCKAGAPRPAAALECDAMLAPAHETHTGGCWRRGATAVTAWLQGMRQPEKLAALKRSLLLGSAAGWASGVMAGLTGMGGPPVMLMFERLAIPKEVVRGTNAACGALQLRILVYLAMGAFSRADAAVSIGGLVGMAAGSLAAAHVRPAAFSRLLTALMVLCCALMFAARPGLGRRRRRRGITADSDCPGCGFVEEGSRGARTRSHADTVQGNAEHALQHRRVRVLSDG